MHSKINFSQCPLQYFYFTSAPSSFLVEVALSNSILQRGKYTHISKPNFTKSIPVIVSTLFFSCTLPMPRMAPKQISFHWHYYVSFDVACAPTISLMLSSLISILFAVHRQSSFENNCRFSLTTVTASTESFHLHLHVLHVLDIWNETQN